MPEGISAAPETAAETVGVTSEAERDPLVPDETQEPPVTPVMPTPPFPSFQSTPTLPHQSPGNGFESGRDSRAR